MSIAAPVATVPAARSRTRPRFGRNAYGLMADELRDQTRAELRRRVARFKEIAPMLPQPGAGYLRELIFHERRLVHEIRRARTRGLFHATYGAYALLITGYFLLMLALEQSAPGRELPGDSFFMAYFAMSGTFALAFAGAQHVEREGKRRWSRGLAEMLRNLLSWTWLLALVLGLMLTAGIARGETLNGKTWFYAAIVGAPFARFSVAAFKIVLRRGERRAGRSAHNPHPESLVVHELVEMLRTSGGSPARWGRLDVRNRLIGHLEAAARCFEEYIPARVAAGGMHAAVENDCRRIAAGFREMVHWVWSPRPDTQQHFQRRVAGILHALLTGTWDGIPRALAEPRTRFHVGRWTLRTLRALTAIAAPAAAVLALEASGHPLPGTVAGGLLALSVIGAMLWIDDKLPAKLALMEQAGKAVTSLKPKS